MKTLLQEVNLSAESLPLLSPPPAQTHNIHTNPCPRAVVVFGSAVDKKHPNNNYVRVFGKARGWGAKEEATIIFFFCFPLVRASVLKLNEEIRGS